MASHSSPRTINRMYSISFKRGTIGKAIQGLSPFTTEIVDKTSRDLTNTLDQFNHYKSEVQRERQVTFKPTETQKAEVARIEETIQGFESEIRQMQATLKPYGRRDLMPSIRFQQEQVDNLRKRLSETPRLLNAAEGETPLDVLATVLMQTDMEQSALPNPNPRYTELAQELRVKEEELANLERINGYKARIVELKAEIKKHEPALASARIEYDRVLVDCETAWSQRLEKDDSFKTAVENFSTYRKRVAEAFTPKMIIQAYRLVVNHDLEPESFGEVFSELSMRFIELLTNSEISKEAHKNSWIIAMAWAVHYVVKQYAVSLEREGTPETMSLEDAEFHGLTSGANITNLMEFDLGIADAEEVVSGFYARQELANTVGDLLSRFSSLERQVLEARFGIGTQELSRVDIAARTGIAMHTIRRTEFEALRMLRKPVHTSVLRPYFEGNEEMFDETKNISTSFFRFFV